jgi:zinc/manganese transport system permease protein
MPGRHPRLFRHPGPRRKVIFVDLALAQIAALGATWHSCSAIRRRAWHLWLFARFTLLAAVLLAFTRAWGTRVPQEALIGVIYVVAAAAAILLIDRAPQGAEHLKQILTGNILTSGLNDVAVIVPLYAAVGLLHWLARRLTGAGSLVWEFVFYATFRRDRDQSVAIAGVLLVFSFLIIPAAIGVMFAARSQGSSRSAGSSARHQRRRPCGVFAFDLPTGAAMVCAFGVAGRCRDALSVSARRSPQGLARRDRNRALDVRRDLWRAPRCSWRRAPRATSR